MCREAQRKASVVRGQVAYLPEQPTIPGGERALRGHDEVETMVHRRPDDRRVMVPLRPDGCVLLSAAVMAESARHRPALRP